MAVAVSQFGTPFEVIEWQPTVTQMLDEHHLVAWSPSARARLRFAVGLTSFLESLHGTEVCPFYGKYIHDLDSFCHMLERCLPGGPLERRIDGPRGVTDMLRSRDALPGQMPARYRYYIWHDADALLQRDQKLFARLIDAMMGVAAEAEYLDDDALLIHRVVFVGGPMLDVYGEDPRGQLRSWLPDPAGEPFWLTATGLATPPVQRSPIERMAGEDL